MLLLYISLLLLPILYFKYVRYYIYSYFFNYLYEHKRLSMLLGIKYVDDTTFEPQFENTRIYLAGLFAKLFMWFTGIPVPTPVETRKELLRLQGQFAKNISMEGYIDSIVGKKMTLAEFETSLSSFILKETNRVFELMTEDEEKIVFEHLQEIRTVLAGLTGGESRSIKTFITGLKNIKKVMTVLKNKSDAQKLLILIPHLTMIDNFSKMLVQTKKPMSEIEMKDFFDYTSKFFVILHNNELTFINRSPDDKNTENNRAFGIRPAYFCPGSVYVAKFVKSVIEFLKCMDIKIEGEATISTKRFRTIENKNDVHVTFMKSNRVYDKINTLLESE